MLLDLSDIGKDHLGNFIQNNTQNNANGRSAEPLTFADLLASYLFNQTNTLSKMKAYDIGKTLLEKKKIELDKTDLQDLKTEIDKSQINNFASAYFINKIDTLLLQK